MGQEFVIAEMKRDKTTKGADYLKLKLGDLWVSFFNKTDVSKTVKIGDRISCDLEKKGEFTNGSKLAILQGTSNTPNETDLMNSSKLESILERIAIAQERIADFFTKK